MSKSAADQGKVGTARDGAVAVLTRGRNVIELTEHGGRDLEPGYQDEGERVSYRDPP